MKWFRNENEIELLQSQARAERVLSGKECFKNQELRIKNKESRIKKQDLKLSSHLKSHLKRH